MLQQHKPPFIRHIHHSLPPATQTQTQKKKKTLPRRPSPSPRSSSVSVTDPSPSSSPHSSKKLVKFILKVPHSPPHSSSSSPPLSASPSPLASPSPSAASSAAARSNRHSQQHTFLSQQQRSLHNSNHAQAKLLPPIHPPPPPHHQQHQQQQQQQPRHLARSPAVLPKKLLHHHSQQQDQHQKQKQKQKEAEQVAVSPPTASSQQTKIQRKDQKQPFSPNQAKQAEKSAGFARSRYCYEEEEEEEVEEEEEEEEEEDDDDADDDDSDDEAEVDAEAEQSGEEQQQEEEDARHLHRAKSKRRKQVDLRDLQKSGCSPPSKRHKADLDLRSQLQEVAIASSTSGNWPQSLVKPNASRQISSSPLRKLPPNPNPNPNANKAFNGSSIDAPPSRSGHDSVLKSQSPPSFSVAAPSSAISELEESQKPSKKRKLRSSAVDSASLESCHSLSQNKTSTSAPPQSEVEAMPRGTTYPQDGEGEEEMEGEAASPKPYPESEASKDSAAVTLSPRRDSYHDGNDDNDNDDHDENENDGAHELAPAKHLLKSVLDRLQKKDKFGAFAQPVDPKEVPNYCDIIKLPMDFGTMRKRITSGYYTSLVPFERDIFTICDNAMTYNAKGTVYFRHARSIKDVAERILKELRVPRSTIETDEMPSKQKPAGSVSIKKPHKKQFGIRLIHESVSEDVSLENTQAAEGDMGGNASVSALPESSVQNAERSFYTESPSETKDNTQEDTSGSFLRTVGRSPTFYENRRNTYVPSVTSSQDLDPVVTTICGESLQIVPTGHQLDFPYARSLARFAADLGPIVWKVASKQIETALPHGYLFGPGWVGDREAPGVASSPANRQQIQLQPNFETMDKTMEENMRSTNAVVNQEICGKFSEYPHAQSVDLQVASENKAPSCRGSMVKHNNKQGNFTLMNSNKQVQPPNAQANERVENPDSLPAGSSTNFQANYDSLLSNGHHPHTQCSALGLNSENHTASAKSNHSYTQGDPQAMTKIPHETTSLSKERSWKVNLQSNAQAMEKMLHQNFIANDQGPNKLDRNSSPKSNPSSAQMMPRLSHENRHQAPSTASAPVDSENQKNTTGQMTMNSSSPHVPYDPVAIKKSGQQAYLDCDSQRLANMPSPYDRPAESEKSLDSSNEPPKGTSSTFISGATMNLNHPASDNAMLFGNRVSVGDNSLKSKDSVLITENSSKTSNSESMPAVPTTSSACFPFMGKFLRKNDLQVENAIKSFDGKQLDINCNAAVTKGSTLTQCENQSAYSVVNGIKYLNASERNLDMNCSAAGVKGPSLSQSDSQTAYSASRENSSSDNGKGLNAPVTNSWNILNYTHSTQVENARKSFNGRTLDANRSAAVVKGTSLNQSESQSAYSVNQEKYSSASESCNANSNLFLNTKNHNMSKSIQSIPAENASKYFIGRNLDVNCGAQVMRGASANQYESQAAYPLDRESHSSANGSGKASSNGPPNTKNYSVNNSIQSALMENASTHFDGRNSDVTSVMKNASLNQSESQAAYLPNRENYINATGSGKASNNGPLNAKNYPVSSSIPLTQMENSSNGRNLDVNGNGPAIKGSSRNLDVNGNAAVIKGSSFNISESQTAYLINRENYLNACESIKSSLTGPSNYQTSNSIQSADGSKLHQSLNVSSPRSSVGGSKDSKTMQSFSGNREMNSVESAQANSLLQYNQFNSLQDASSTGIRMKAIASHHNNAMQPAPAAMLPHNLNSPVQHSFINSQMGIREMNLLAEKGLNARSSFMGQASNSNSLENSEERTSYSNQTASVVKQHHEQFSENKNGSMGSPTGSYSSVFSTINGGSRFREDQRIHGSIPLQRPDANGSQQLPRSSEMQATQQPVAASVPWQGGRFQANGNERHVMPNVPHFLQKHLSKGSSDSPPTQNHNMQSTASGTQYVRPSESWNPKAVMQMQAQDHGLHSGSIVAPSMKPGVWHYAEPPRTSSQGSVSFSGAPDLNVSLSHTKSPYEHHQSSGNEMQQPDLALQL